MDEGQEIELNIQHEEGETKITLKKPHTKATKENGTTTPPNSPDTPRREPRAVSPKNEQATIPRIKIPIPAVIPRATKAQDDRHMDATTQGQHTHGNRTATPKPTQVQDNRHSDPMEEEHHTYGNKPLLVQGLGRGSRLRGTQGEKQQETPEYSCLLYTSPSPRD